MKLKLDIIWNIVNNGIFIKILKLCSNYIEKKSKKMKILIIGAGVFGSNLIHSIKKENNITILSKNKIYENKKNKSKIRN